MMAFVPSNWLTRRLHRTERYFELLKESKVKGHLWQQQNYAPK